ncbi:MAG: hypothetical protein U0R52_08190 [Solirubrobacterales bacterium]
MLAVVADLMLASRVEGSLRAAGHEVEVQAAMPGEVSAEALVCDLDCVDPEAAAATGIPALGFYSHVDVETRDRASAAGVSMVVPRSRMARELPVLVERLLGGGSPDA